MRAAAAPLPPTAAALPAPAGGLPRLPALAVEPAPATLACIDEEEAGLLLLPADDDDDAMAVAEGRDEAVVAFSSREAD